ncbi:MAG TPA: ACT domain-containing protein [Steroidobacteraceae bacterium]|nr:ACT domain-containing protein [Steroidobacteraceae bacterium]
MSEKSNRIIVTVLGQDRTGIIAETSRALADAGVNIVDISQTVLGEFFVMIMLADMSHARVGLGELKTQLSAKAGQLGLQINAQHEDVFKFMHRV